MRLSRKVQYIILTILVMLNIALRYPITPHEIGWDSFFIHGLANSISTYGYAKWWIHPLSAFGYYPFSYASAVPLILSGMSQTTGLNMELTIWIFCVIEGVLSTLFAYMMAGEIKNSEFFKFVVALAFSISSGMLWFTTWTASTRGLLLVFVPLFIYFLLKTRTYSKIKHGSLCIAIFIVSMTTHNLYIILIFILVAYLGGRFLYKLKKQLSIHTKIPKPITFLVTIALFALVFYLPFSGIGTKWFSYYGVKHLGYRQISELSITYGGRIGILVFIGVIGFVMLLYKKEKNQLDLFLIISALSFTPLLFSLNYTSLGVLILSSILIGLGSLDLTKFLNKKNAKASICTIIVIMVVAISWTGLAQVWHPGILRESAPIQPRYMTDSSFNAAMWLDRYLNPNERMVANDGTLSIRLSAVSEVQSTLQTGPYELINGFVDKDLIKVKLKPIYQWLDGGPFALVDPYRTDYSYWYELYKYNCDDPWSDQMISKFNLIYAIENTKVAGKQTWPNEIPDSKFFESLHSAKYKVYDNGDINAWYL